MVKGFFCDSKVCLLGYCKQVVLTADVCVFRVKGCVECGGPLVWDTLVQM